MSQLKSPKEKVSSKDTQARQPIYQTANFDYKSLHIDRHLKPLDLSLLIPNGSKSVASTGSLLLDSLIEDGTNESFILQDLCLIEVSAFRQADQRQERLESQERLEQSYSKPTVYPAPSDEVSDYESSGAIAKKSYSSKQPSTESQSQQNPSPQQAAASTADDGPVARESAASVGLLDIDDALLFGGAYSRLFSTDPYIAKVDDSRIYILTYLLRHLSAFKVTQLQDGFPNNADPAVINRPDPPRYLTVLEMSNFSLDDSDLIDDLDSLDKLAAKDAQLRQKDPKSELDGLNEQMQALVERVEFLSKKLGQVTTS